MEADLGRGAGKDLGLRHLVGERGDLYRRFIGLVTWVFLEVYLSIHALDDFEVFELFRFRHLFRSLDGLSLHSLKFIIKDLKKRFKS